MMKTLYRISIAYMLMCLTVSCKADVQVDSLWNREFACAQELIDTYVNAKKSIGRRDKEQQTLNMCHYVWHCGEYMFKCKGKNEDITMLPEHVAALGLDNSIVVKFMEERNIERFTDHYFTLMAMKEGSSFDEARDGLTITVFYPARALNSNDYNKLKEVFSCSNGKLHEVYLKKLVHPLTNSGCSERLLEARRLIEQNVAESELKGKILELYDRYATIMPGSPAPDVAFNDVNGNRHTIGQYLGKVIVLDIWATWCSSCLKNMSKFIELKNSYSSNDNVMFATVSTDSDDIRDRWLAAIKRFKMDEMLNLMPDRSTADHFEERYYITSVPRYIVIDKDGNIVSAFAPKPGKELEEMINSLL